MIIPRPVFDMLQFDEEVCDDWHLYAVDYSLSVARLGLDAYVIPASIHHWSPGIFSGRNVLHVISSVGFLPAGYYRILGKLLKKHRSHTKQVYTTCGLWSTSYPLTLVRAKEVLRAVLYAHLKKAEDLRVALYYQTLVRVLRFVVTKGIVSKPRNACKRILSAVKHLPDSDA